MLQNRICWTIGENSYLDFYPILYYQIIAVHRVETVDTGKIMLTNWCQWNIQMQASHELLWYLLHRIRYLIMIPMMVYDHTWCHNLKHI